MYIHMYVHRTTAIAVVVGVSHLSGGRQSLRRLHKLAKKVCGIAHVCACGVQCGYDGIDVYMVWHVYAHMYSV